MITIYLQLIDSYNKKIIDYDIFFISLVINSKILFIFKTFLYNKKHFIRSKKNY